MPVAQNSIMIPALTVIVFPFVLLTLAIVLAGFNNNNTVGSGSNLTGSKSRWNDPPLIPNPDTGQVGGQ